MRAKFKGKCNVFLKSSRATAAVHKVRAKSVRCINIFFRPGFHPIYTYNLHVLPLLPS